jgi:hypothetical protein
VPVGSRVGGSDGRCLEAPDRGAVRHSSDGDGGAPVPATAALR